MQEINELKNLVIQSLETGGVLSQIRAQIRSSVFKVIDNDGAKKNGGAWENPLCYKLHETPEGALAFGILHDFLTAYHMDYTMNVFQHESNLQEVDSRELLYNKLGLKGTSAPNNQPVLLALIKNAVAPPKEPENGGKTQPPPPPSEKTQPEKQRESQQPAGKPTGTLNETGKASPPTQTQSNNGKPQQPAVGNTKQNAPQAGNLGGNASMDTNLEKKRLAEAKNLLSKFEMNKIESTIAKQEQSDEDYQQDSFEPEIDENIEALPPKISQQPSDESHMKESGRFTGSEEIGISQSQGLDISVNSVALEDYDYFEDVEKVTFKRDEFRENAFDF